MSTETQGTVTQKSNGVVVITPKDAAHAPFDRVELHYAGSGSKQLPAMGDEITVSVTVTTPAAEANPTPVPESVPVSLVESEPAAGTAGTRRRT